MDKLIKKNEVWFQTDLGFEETKDRLFNSKLIIGDGEGSKGRLTFHIKDFKDYTVQITKGGKVGIYYPDGCDYEILLEKLSPFLVTPEGNPAQIFEVIKDTEERFPWVSPYVKLPDNLRLYREIFEDLVRIYWSQGPKLKSYLDTQCKYCEKDPSKPPALPRLCGNCYGSLHSIVVDELTEYFPKKVPSAIIALFLLYEYKAHILMYACDEIRRGYLELNDEDFAILFESLRQRVRRLEDFDASLEPKIPEYVFFVLPIAPPKDANRAINLAIEAVKWHMIRECSKSNPKIDKKFVDAYDTFEDKGKRIINKASGSASIRDFNKKLKRAFHILKRIEARRKELPDF